MEINIDKLENDSKLVDEAGKLTPKFSNNEEAITFYTSQLESLCFKYNKSGQEMVALSEKFPLFNEDYSEVLSLQRKINFLTRV